MSRFRSALRFAKGKLRKTGTVPVAYILGLSLFFLPVFPYPALLDQPGRLRNSRTVSAPAYSSEWGQVEPTLFLRRSELRGRPANDKKFNPAAVPVRRARAPGAGVQEVPDCA
ncbi:MAG: hypothetical protein ACRENW_08580 [Thermodesulfobacteriota bacterium]